MCVYTFYKNAIYFSWPAKRTANDLRRIRGQTPPKAKANKEGDCLQIYLKASNTLSFHRQIVRSAQFLSAKLQP